MSDLPRSPPPGHGSRFLTLLAVGLLAGPALALDSVSGTWSHDDVTLTLKDEGGVFTGEYRLGRARGQVRGGRVDLVLLGNYTGTNGAGVFSARREGDDLLARWGGITVVLQPGAGRGSPQESGSVEPAPRIIHEDATNGWTVTAPRGWQFSGQGPQLMLTSSAQEGRIRVLFAPGLDVDGAIDLLTDTEDTSTGQWRPNGEPRVIKVADGKAMVVGGQLLRNGVTLAAHRAVIMGPRGAVVLAGSAPLRSAAGLQKGVEDAAASVRFRR